MKYTKQIVILMVINLVIAFLLIYVGHITRELELSNFKLKKEINKTEQKININKIEYTFHNNTAYLKKIYELYNPSIEEEKNNIVISLSDFSKIKREDILLVNLK